ncbi:MAG: hypothetical protein U0934_09865 [Pseudotabrizicola sp.]|uniref:hypothetical protein n=1 Tax=Pseudotabrizicola sp. TaxID=2939647 RepID=UPI00272EF2A0|nr:hypothetical protein [Pseudotabrizicola sp.]MDZ7574249.1 hypothetical protein [Pseudotabrizicola sp.]
MTFVLELFQRQLGKVPRLNKPADIVDQSDFSSEISFAEPAVVAHPAPRSFRINHPSAPRHSHPVRDQDCFIGSGACLRTIDGYPAHMMPALAS